MGDVLGEIGAALELGQYQEEPDQLAESSGIEIAGLDAPPDDELELGGQLVDLLVPVDHRLAQFEITVEEGPGSPGDRLPHEREEAEDGLLHRWRHGQKHTQGGQSQFTPCSRRVHLAVTRVPHGQGLLHPLMIERML